MFEPQSDRDSLIDTRVNFWPPLVDAIACVLVLMFLLYMSVALRPKATPAGDPEEPLARAAMLRLKLEIEEGFRRAGLEKKVHCEYGAYQLRVSFSDAVLFDSKQYQVPKRGRQALEICARALNMPTAPSFEQIQVEGYTDSERLEEGKYPHDNWELSSARAIAVLKQLQDLHVRAKVISANAYADQNKIDERLGREADKNNRRIELKFIYKTPRVAGE